MQETRKRLKPPKPLEVKYPAIEVNWFGNRTSTFSLYRPCTCCTVKSFASQSTPEKANSAATGTLLPLDLFWMEYAE